MIVSSVVKPTFASITMNEGGKLVNHRLNSTHPTFNKLVHALRRKDFARVPSLLNAAQEIANQSQGHILIKKDGVYYKGRKVEDGLTRKIGELLAAHQPVSIWLRFMDNLYKNPEESAQQELYEWLMNFNHGRFAPTDDGCFIAYKMVNPDYTDCHTSTVSNKPGQAIFMKRTDVDPDRNNECSRGFHFCSLGYLGVFAGWKSGNCYHIMAVKINPADVVAIPRDYGFTKGRTWRYEVLRELEDFPADSQTDHQFMQQVFVPVIQEKKDILKALYELPNVSRLLRTKKLTKMSLRKASTQRLRKWFSQFYAMVTPPDMSKLFENPLKPMRVQAGLSIGEIAAECDVPYKVIYNVEAAETPNPQLVDLVIGAIAALKDTKIHGCNHVSYPMLPRSVGSLATAVPADACEEDFAGVVPENHGGYDDPYGYEEVDNEDERDYENDDQD
jgi:hypothetical protein